MGPGGVLDVEGGQLAGERLNRRHGWLQVQLASRDRVLCIIDRVPYSKVLCSFVPQCQWTRDASNISFLSEISRLHHDEFSSIMPAGFVFSIVVNDIHSCLIHYYYWQIRNVPDHDEIFYAVSTLDLTQIVDTITKPCRIFPPTICHSVKGICLDSKWGTIYSCAI